MILRFSSRLYARKALEEAIRRYQGCARLELDESPKGFRVRISEAPAGGRVADEFGNLALVLTMEAR